jgi:K+-sensing histidine kinase KdpD/DNA-binding winged helix-turn-helix (wHTH) protein
MNISLIVAPDRPRGVANEVLAFALALLLVTAATGAGLLIEPRWGTAPVVLLYLPAVLAAAIYCGLWPALGAAIASALAYNYWFTAPYHTLLIHNPADAVTVLMLFVVAVVTSHLAGSLRAQARLAAAHAARNATIAGFARRLLSCAGEPDIARVAVNELSALFECHAVLMTGPDDPQVLAAAPANPALAPSDRAAAAMTLATGEPAGRGVRRVDMADWQFRAVASAQAVAAAVGLGRADGTPPVSDERLPLLESLLDQLALALERARLERETRELATLREQDRLRSALLASIGDNVKPRLTVIASAARALKRDGASDKALTSTVAAESAKLERYIDNLVELSPGSERKPIELGDVIIDLFHRAVLRDGEEVHLTPKEYALLSELARHPGRVLTHGHLLRTVWGPAQSGQIDYLRVAIRSLRQKLEPDPAHPALIKNAPAVGYRLVVPVPPEPTL